MSFKKGGIHMSKDERTINYYRLYKNLCEFMHTRIYVTDENLSRLNCLGLIKLYKNRNYQELHHEICKLMFDLAEDGEELWIRIDEREDIINLENIENYSIDEERSYYRVSIMTQTMLDYDRMMLNLIAEENSNDDLDKNSNDNLHENRYATNMYRPFFLNFLIDIRENPDSIGFLTNPENINQWFIGSFNERREGRVFSGYIERIASPAEYRDHKIEICDKRLPKSVLSNINDVYDLGSNPCSKDEDIKTELGRILEKPEFRKARIYNVGNGNCIYLKGRNSFGKLSLLYDIGYYCTIPAKRIKNTNYQSSVNAIRHLRPHCIILSHWDSDHFFGCAYAGTDIFRCKWIAPNHDENTSVSARRVARYLQVMKKLILVDRTSGRQIARVQGIHSELKLYMGEKRPGKDRKITDCNKEGIVLEYVKYGYYGYHGDIHTLMAGDVPYESIPSIANFSGNTPCDYLIVPHHGAKMDTKLLSSTSKRRGFAIICAKQGRPETAHTDALKNNGYSFKITGDARLCIDLDLLNKRLPRVH